MERGAWRATSHGVTRSQTQLKQLSTQHTQKYRNVCPRRELSELYLSHSSFPHPVEAAPVCREFLLVSMYSKSLTYEPSSCKLLKLGTCPCVSAVILDHCTFQGAVRLTNVFFICSICLLCIICMRSITNLVQYYIVNCVS